MKQKLESLLFISNKPLKIKQLADFCNTGKAEVETILESLKEEYNKNEKGIKIVEHDGKIQMTTSQDSSEVIEKFLKEELTGEMTRPQLETLTIVAYRGPMTKMEIEQIRGVNCSLILRNLLMRGLVESNVDKKTGMPVYQVTSGFVRHLGLIEIKNLPDYEKLNRHETLNELLNRDN